MSGKSLLADTNIILYLLGGNREVLDYLQDNEVSISVITEMELLSFSELTDSDTETIKQLLKTLRIVELNNAVKDVAIALRKKYKLKLPDCIVLASAVYLEIPLLTADKQLTKIENEADVILYDV